MAIDCFGNPMPGIPPSISDDFASIYRYRPIPLSQRLDYNDARVATMIGQGDPAIAWDMLWKMQAQLWALDD